MTAEVVFCFDTKLKAFHVNALNLNQIHLHKTLKVNLHTL